MSELLSNVKGEKEALDFMKDATILPCPFCGSPPRYGCLDPGAPYPGGYYYIACENGSCPCDSGVDMGARAVKKGRSVDALFIMKNLLSRWNTRV